MTIAASWIRKVNSCEELVFISDSRLCGGHRWDECPKIMTLPRKDCVLCFAGNTDYSYPMMMQVSNSMSAFSHISSRAMDLKDLNGYILKHINHLSQSVYNMADPEEQAENEFIFGGYSWVEKSFYLWRYYYNIHDRTFSKDGQQHRIISTIPGNIVVIGDQKKEFKRELRTILRTRYGQGLENYHGNGLDFEPFEALRNMLQVATPTSTIGGAPQMVKTYQYMNSRPVGIYWPRRVEDIFQNRTLLGRKMFDFENTEYWFLDPMSLQTSPCIRNPQTSEV